MTRSDKLSPEERAARARFITHYAVKQFWLPGSVVMGLVFFWFEHRSNLRWSAGRIVELAVDVAIWVVLFGWVGGRLWGALMYSAMRSKLPNWRPPAG